MRKLKIPVGLVLTSTTQRAVDTGALLGFSDVTATPDLTESGSAVSADENNRRAQALRKLVAGRPPADNNLVIVSHKPNIVDAFGKDWLDVREGEASVLNRTAAAVTSWLSASPRASGAGSRRGRIDTSRRWLRQFICSGGGASVP